MSEWSELKKGSPWVTKSMTREEFLDSANIILDRHIAGYLTRKQAASEMADLTILYCQNR